MRMYSWITQMFVLCQDRTSDTTQTWFGAVTYTVLLSGQSKCLLKQWYICICLRDTQCTVTSPQLFQTVQRPSPSETANVFINKSFQALGSDLKIYLLINISNHKYQRYIKTFLKLIQFQMFNHINLLKIFGFTENRTK